MEFNQSQIKCFSLYVYDDNHKNDSNIILIRYIYLF